MLIGFLRYVYVSSIYQSFFLLDLLESFALCTCSSVTVWACGCWPQYRLSVAVEKRVVQITGGVYLPLTQFMEKSAVYIYCLSTAKARVLYTFTL